MTSRPSRVPCVLLVAALFPLQAPASTPALVRDYVLGSGLADAAKRGAALAPIGGRIQGDRFRFAEGEGLSLPDPGVDDSYSLELRFRLDEVDGYRKLVDFSGRQRDQGLYVFNGELLFYDFAGGGRITAGHEHVIRIDRFPDGRFAAYLDDLPAFEFLDAGKHALLGKGAFLFLDDNDGTERAAGEVWRIRVWNAPRGETPPVIPRAVPPLLRDYPFRDSLKDRLKGPELTRLGGGVVDAGYTFAPGDGLHLEDTGVLDHYTVEMEVSLDGVTGYRKLIDFQGLESDRGLYVYNGALTFYQLGSGGTLAADRVHRVRLERDGPTGVVRGSVDGRPAFQFLDRDRSAVFRTQMAHFVRDDLQTESEHGAGRLIRLRIWGGPGGLDEV